MEKVPGRKYGSKNTLRELVPSSAGGRHSKRQKKCQIQAAAERRTANLGLKREMKKLRTTAFATILLATLASAHAQVQATQRAGFGLPPGQTVAPNTPGG